MPSPNPLNPICPYCHKPMSSNGVQKSGASVYRCRRGCKNANGATVTITISDRPAMRNGERTGKAKSDRQYRLEWKERDPIGYAESQKRRNAKRKAKKKADRENAKK